MRLPTPAASRTAPAWRFPGATPPARPLPDRTTTPPRAAQQALEQRLLAASADFAERHPGARQWLLPAGEATPPTAALIGALLAARAERRPCLLRLDHAVPRYGEAGLRMLLRAVGHWAPGATTVLIELPPGLRVPVQTWVGLHPRLRVDAEHRLPWGAGWLGWLAAGAYRLLHARERHSLLVLGVDA